MILAVKDNREIKITDDQKEAYAKSGYKVLTKTEGKTGDKTKPKGGTSTAGTATAGTGITEDS